LKENILQQVQKIKQYDTVELDKAVEEIKSQEANKLSELNKTYTELDMRAKKLDRKNDRYNVIIESWIDQWRKKRLSKLLYGFWKNWWHLKAREKRQLTYCDEFYHAGLRRRGIKAFKLFAQIAGNRLYEARIKEKVNIEVDAKVIEKKN